MSEVYEEGYDAGMKILEEKFGGGKDNVISLATIAREPNTAGQPRPVVRDVDAFYENGVFYVAANANTNKMKQIALNPEVSIAVHFGWFSANGVAENLGWVLDAKNAELRTKIRNAFEWYDSVTNEDDESNIFLAIRLTRGVIILDHHAKYYYMDFVNKTETPEGQIL